MKSSVSFCRFEIVPVGIASAEPTSSASTTAARSLVCIVKQEVTYQIFHEQGTEFIDQRALL